MAWFLSTIRWIVSEMRTTDKFRWGVLGALFAGLFAIWMFFVPDSIQQKFAWDVKPRYAQLFIGAGYVFRTIFFLYVAYQPNWFRLRWIVWGNLVFTGTLLLATYWHLDEFKWDPINETPFGHIWLVLYVFEPVTMLYLIPRGILRQEAPVSGGPLDPWFRRFLILIAATLLLNGLLLVFDPVFSAERWPWELNSLDAGIVAAWFLGWAAWSGTMAFARDWDEIRGAAGLFILNGIALGATILISWGYLDAWALAETETKTHWGYAAGVALMTILMAVFAYRQEQRRVSPP